MPHRGLSFNKPQCQHGILGIHRRPIDRLIQGQHVAGSNDFKTYTWASMFSGRCSLDVLGQWGLFPPKIAPISFSKPREFVKRRRNRSLSEYPLGCKYPAGYDMKGRPRSLTTYAAVGPNAHELTCSKTARTTHRLLAPHPRGLRLNFVIRRWSEFFLNVRPVLF